MMMRAIFITVTLSALMVGLSKGHATTDMAWAKSIYFTAASEGSDDGTSRLYANSWRAWIQVHRAIEQRPDLRKELLRKPARYDSGLGRRLSWLHSRLPAAFARSQPTHVYILQLAVFRRSRSLGTFIAEKWPRVAKVHVYARTSKDFYVGFSSEADSKADPLYARRGQTRLGSLWCLDYGIYASPHDAASDAAQMKKYLGFQPVIRRTVLTPRLARAFIFEPVAGRMQPTGAPGLRLNW